MFRSKAFQFILSSSLLISTPAYCRAIPEVRDFLNEEVDQVGGAMLTQEDGLSATGRKFRFEVFALRIRGLVGFDAANAVNVTLIPEVELFFEREPEKRP